MLIKVHVWSHRNLLVTFSYGIPLARVCIRSASCLSGIVKGVLCFGYQGLAAGRPISYA